MSATLKGNIGRCISFAVSTWILASLFIAVLFAPASSANAVDESEQALELDILGSSVEELLQLNITSVSKVKHTVQETAAAVTVLSNEQIRRSGATSIPEALRLVPGVQVARIDANKWAVSIRGFNARAANKLLVMIDGRTIYDQLFSGTLWETKDVMLEDVDRIEVIRGPGGSTWGANAVNGVINIITKSAADTQGGLVTAGGGSEERAFSSVRYGDKFSENSYYRIWAQYHNRDEGYLYGDGSNDDSWQGHGGFRLDGKVDKSSSYTVLANIYGNDSDGTSMFGDLDGEGHSLHVKWEEQLSPDSKLDIQAFYDHTAIEASIYDERRHTAELDITHSLSLRENLQLIYGGTYRYTTDDIDGTEFVTLEPNHRSNTQPSIFGKLRSELIPTAVRAEIGAKLEHNDYTGFEFQPDANIFWQIHDNHALWARVSRAVRIPSRIENDFLFTSPLDGTLLFRGSTDLDAETLIAYELGYRLTPRSDLHFDIAAFVNDYDRLVTFEGPTHQNGGRGETYGVELAATWTPFSWWNLSATYSYLEMDLELNRGSIADPLVAIDMVEGNNPHNRAGLRSSVNFLERWQFDAGVRYVDSLSAPSIDSYIVADLRLAWQMRESLELAVVGQNLFEQRHFEHALPDASQVQQGVYGKLTWTF